VSKSDKAYLVTAVKQNANAVSTTTTVSFVRITQCLNVSNNPLLLLRNKTHPKLCTVTQKCLALHTYHLSYKTNKSVIINNDQFNLRFDSLLTARSQA